jgi:hypothetical protein
MSVMVLTVEEFFSRMDGGIGFGPCAGTGLPMAEQPAAAAPDPLADWERELIAEAEPEAPEAAQGLNGPIRKGDRIGIAAGGGLRVGEVLSIEDVRDERGWFLRTAVKVRVDWSSGFHWGRNGKPAMPFVHTYDRPERMVKL